MFDNFTDFVSDVAGSAVGGDFASMFGVATDDPNGWLKTKGKEMGREVMGKLMQAVYQDEGMERPADAVVSRSQHPDDMVANAGLANGSMAAMLAPLVAGIVSAIQDSGVKGEIVEFAKKRAFKTIEEHSDIIRGHGESLGKMVFEGVTKAVKEKGDPAAAAIAQDVTQPAAPGQAARGSGAGDAAAAALMVDTSAFEPAAKDRGPSGGGGDIGDQLAAVIMKPLTRGVNAALGMPGMLDKVIDAVGDWIPLEKVKSTLKSTMQPQYQRACVAVSPQLEKYGGIAGTTILEFLKNPGSGGAGEDAKDKCARAIVENDAAVERELVGPLLTPFMRGVLGKLAEGFQSDIAMGLLGKLFGSCFSSSSGDAAKGTA